MNHNDKNDRCDPISMWPPCRERTPVEVLEDQDTHHMPGAPIVHVLKPFRFVMRDDVSETDK